MDVLVGGTDLFVQEHLTPGENGGQVPSDLLRGHARLAPAPCSRYFILRKIHLLQPA